MNGTYTPPTDQPSLAEFVTALQRVRVTRSRCIDEGYKASILDQIQRAELTKETHKGHIAAGKSGATVSKT